MEGKFPNEFADGTAVPFSKRMDYVQFCHNKSKAVKKNRFLRIGPICFSVDQAANFLKLPIDHCRRIKPCIRFPDLLTAQMSGKRINILKQKTVNTAQMRFAEPAGDRLLQ